MILYEGIFDFPPNKVWHTALTHTRMLLLGRMANQWIKRFFLSGQGSPNTRRFQCLRLHVREDFGSVSHPGPASPSLVCGSLLIQLISF